MDDDTSDGTPEGPQLLFCKIPRAELRTVRLSLTDMHHRLYTVWVTLSDKRIDALLKEWEVINSIIQKTEIVSEELYVECLHCTSMKSGLTILYSTPKCSKIKQEAQSLGWNDFLLDCGIEKTIRGLVSRLPELKGFSATTMTTFLKTFEMSDLTEVRNAVKQEIIQDPDFVDDFEMKLRKFIVVFFSTKLQTQMVQDLVKEFVQI